MIDNDDCSRRRGKILKTEADVAISAHRVERETFLRVCAGQKGESVNDIVEARTNLETAKHNEAVALRRYTAFMRHGITPSDVIRSAQASSAAR